MFAGNKVTYIELSENNNLAETRGADLIPPPANAARLAFIIMLIATILLSVFQAGNMFGAPGYGGQVGYVDPNYKLGYGFVSRYMIHQWGFR